MIFREYYLHCVTPLHVGGGEARAGVEGSVVRNESTGIPIVPGSGIKGVLRDASLDHSGEETELTRRVFGSEGPDGAAGALTIHDANLLALPVRSGAGTFALITSPFLLRQFIRDRRLFSSEEETESLRTRELPEPAFGEVVVAPGSNLLNAVDGAAAIAVLEDMTYARKEDERIERIWTEIVLSALASDDAPILRGRFALVHDDVMTFFCRYGLPVVARNSLDHDTKQSRQLWNEEVLPPETVLAGIASYEMRRRDRRELADQAVSARERESFAEIENTLLERPIQLGGEATVGRGICRMTIATGTM